MTSTAESSSPSSEQCAPVRIVLASASPRRFDLLTQLGLEFEVLPSCLEETLEEGLAPSQVVLRLAEDKARAVASLEKILAEPSLVLGADTIVVLNGQILGKPSSRADAIEMLSALSGKRHDVYTGVSIVRTMKGSPEPTRTLSSRYEISSVYFRKIERAEIEAYVRTPEPMDKAGSYALQGLGSAFVERIEGCYTNIIGLPIPLTVQMTRQAGVKILGIP